MLTNRNTVPQALREFFLNNPKLALAFSGGSDSAYLLYAAKECGTDVGAYYVRSRFQAAFEFEDALRLADELGVQLRVLDIDVLSDEKIVSNPANRCYHCKKHIFSAIIEAARADGYRTVIDGTNASDDASDRPGMRALEEMGVRSPLRECGITKAELRAYSQAAGLFTWNKPAYACLATRIPCGMLIDAEWLKKVEKAEKALSAMGFIDFRVRLTNDGSAKIQLHKDQLGLFGVLREKVYVSLKEDFESVLLDLRLRGE